MPELVTIPVSFVEILIDFERPDVRIWLDRSTIVQSVFEAMQPWNANLDDIELVTTGKVSEQGVTFKIASKRISFFLGSSCCRFTRDAVDWQLAEETLVILNALLNAVVQSTHVVMATRRTKIALHVQPRTASFMSILSPFIPSQLGALGEEAAERMAAVIKWPKRKVTLDGSATIANGLFLQFERDFDGKIEFLDILQILSRDEEELFRILDIKEDRG